MGLQPTPDFQPLISVCPQGVHGSLVHSLVQTPFFTGLIWMYCNQSGQSRPAALFGFSHTRILPTTRLSDLYLSIYLPTYPSIHPPIYSFIRVSIYRYRSSDVSVCLSINLLIYPSIQLSMYLFNLSNLSNLSNLFNLSI